MAKGPCPRPGSPSGDTTPSTCSQSLQRCQVRAAPGLFVVELRVRFRPVLSGVQVLPGGRETQVDEHATLGTGWRWSAEMAGPGVAGLAHGRSRLDP